MLSLNTAIDLRSMGYAAVSILLLCVGFLLSRGVKKRKDVFIYLTIACNTVYLLWRALYTLPFSYGAASAVLGLLLLGAELVGFFQSLVFRLIFIKPNRTPSHTLAEWAEPPTVDVLIATYNEDMSILRKTIIACQNLDYPAEKLSIVLCDDGNRESAHALCEELGVRHMTRADHAHAKAGNLNNALSHTQGEFVMLLDADMVPKSNFLQRTMGYLIDPNVGFVQTPQIFYNPDPFQFNLHLNRRIPNEQDLFMLDIQAARANFNAVMHVGTNAVFRRSALTAIGGIPTGTITEDMATGMLLQARGYQSVFVKEVLCTGLSVESFSDLIRQRERWCRGNIQVAKKWNPLTTRGLTFAQRAIYLDGLVYWFFGVQKIIYIVCPLIYLIFSTVILQASAQDLIRFWLPSYLASFLSYRALSRDNRSLAWRHIYEVAMAPHLALAALVEAIFARPIPFRVTPKGLNSDRTTFAWQTSLPFLFLMLATVLAWVMTVRNAAFRPGDVSSFMINVAWSLYNAAAIAASILVCVERPRKRTAERTVPDETMTVRLGDDDCRVTDISEAGMQVECCEKAKDRESSERVHLFSESIGDINGHVVWEKKVDHSKRFGVAFDRYTNATYRKLLKVISDRNKGYHENRQK